MKIYTKLSKAPPPKNRLIDPPVLEKYSICFMFDVQLAVPL